MLDSLWTLSEAGFAGLLGIFRIAGDRLMPDLRILFAWSVKWDQKLGHELRCIMEQNTKHVEGQIHGQETTATHTGLKVPGGAGGG